LGSSVTIWPRRPRICVNTVRRKPDDLSQHQPGLSRFVRA
jgi:hypothetical protein